MLQRAAQNNQEGLKTENVVQRSGAHQTETWHIMKHNRDQAIRLSNRQANSFRQKYAMTAPNPIPGGAISMLQSLIGVSGTWRRLQEASTGQVTFTRLVPSVDRYRSRNALEYPSNATHASH